MALFFFSFPSSAPPLLCFRRPTFRAAAGAAEVKEDIVVVGGGIAGLAVAVALRKVGLPSIVLEQGSALRSGGTSLTLFSNGWRVLDAIDVADDLRSKYLRIHGMVMRAANGRELRSFRFEDEAPGQEVRAVERSAILEALASRLPRENISFSSRLETIASDEGDDGRTMLQLDDGRRIRAKIVIGCDGVNSRVAKWMGFPAPRFVGHIAFRGLGEYPGGQPFTPQVNYIYGRGLRAGFVPVSSTKVYWFICFNSTSPAGYSFGRPAALKREALDLVRGWPSQLLDVIDRTAEDTVIRTPLVDRWLWPGFTPPAWRDGVVVVGDAWHPMTPNLGQGACCALEDAVVLARKLAASGEDGLETALEEYGRERWQRVFPLTVRANLVGGLLQWDNPAACASRDEVVIPRLVRLAPFLQHTNFQV